MTETMDLIIIMKGGKFTLNQVNINSTIGDIKVLFLEKIQQKFDKLYFYDLNIEMQDSKILSDYYTINHTIHASDTDSVRVKIQIIEDSELYIENFKLNMDIFDIRRSICERKSYKDEKIVLILNYKELYDYRLLYEYNPKNEDTIIAIRLSWK